MTSKGLTLIELLIVVSILWLLAAIALPKYEMVVAGPKYEIVERIDVQKSMYDETMLHYRDAKDLAISCKPLDTHGEMLSCTASGVAGVEFDASAKPIKFGKIIATAICSSSTSYCSDFDVSSS